MEYIRSENEEFFDTTEYKSDRLVVDIEEILDGLDTSKATNSQLRILHKICDLAEDL